uniref:Diphthamide biosynthesis protein 1 n=1 Tax=Aegilops tauschii subsp. strangulata TaxID=200361 RepID=A0A453Q165_AEGTS
AFSRCCSSWGGSPRTEQKLNKSIFPSLPTRRRRRRHGRRRPLPTSLAVTAAGAPQSSAKKKPAPKRFIHTPIPASILNDPTLAAAATSLLPAAYNFELHKTAHRIRSSGARRAALQLPEGLLLFSLPLSHLLGPFLAEDPSNDVLILADPTYGACCLGDRPAKALAADLLVHYGHSCLVPVTSSLLPVLYVFV